MSPKNVLVAVAWPYVNGDLHIGHLAGYLFPADIYARFHRFVGNNVLMVSGSDCHGTPITFEADKRGISPAALIEEYHPKTVELFKLLELTYDNYTKTSTPHHAKVTQDFFLKFLEQGYIIKGRTQQYYSSEEKRFLPDRYVEGICPFCKSDKARSDQCDTCGNPIAEGLLINPISRNSGSPVQLKETEHYFIDWPKLQPFIEKYIAAHEATWRPWIRGETRKWIKEGLQPRAITRDLDWGVAIPSDKIPTEMLLEDWENKRFYVWFDAVIGYFSASVEWAQQVPGRSWEQFWKDPEAIHAHFMGKDNLVFHALFWPGQIHTYDSSLHLPDLMAINQFLTLEGEKFSKSRGVTVDSREIVEKYGLDTVRFYLSSIAPENADANFVWDDFITKTNSVLIANIGNLINRTLKLGNSLSFEGECGIEKATIEAVSTHLTEGYKRFSHADLRDAVENAISLSSWANRYITEKAPWSIKDRAAPEFKTIIGNCVYCIIGLGILLKPIIPQSIEKLEKMLSISIRKWPTNPETELQTLLQQVRIQEPQALFSKIERLD